MNIVFASGKGGTGKTTVAVNFAYLLAQSNYRVQYLDCDVEEPNSHIFLKPKIRERLAVKVMMPEINHEACTNCGSCSSHCQFHALVSLPGEVLFLPKLCHGCGLCVRICPELAITEGEREVGCIEKGIALENIQFIRGLLNVGEPMAGPVIQVVKRHYLEEFIHIVDAPPGTACSVVKTMIDADCVILVTEPTPFGLHDLRIAVSVAKKLGKPIGIFINKENGNFSPLKDYLTEENLPVVATMPEDKEIAVVYSKGGFVIDAFPHYRQCFLELAKNVGELLERTI